MDVISFRKLLVPVIAFIFFSIFGNAQEADPTHGKDTLLFIDAYQEAAIEVLNNSNAYAEFQLKLNNQFFNTEEEIIQEIKDMAPEYADEPLERKAWRYVISKVEFSTALTEQNWGHTPEIILNSIGRGQCDDLASLLGLLWTKLGYESRVWGLGGHVVPEVFIDGKWRMYDPSFQLYYLNKENEIMGVEELSQNPDLIVNPIKRNIYKYGNLVSMTKGQSMIAFSLYSSAENNQVNVSYSSAPNLETKLFKLPPHASLKFPVPFKEAQKNILKAQEKFMQVTLDASERTTLCFPLIIYGIEGTGNIIINSKEFKIGSEELSIYVHTFSLLLTNLEFLPGTHAKVYYLINMRNVPIYQSNKLTFNGSGVDHLLAKISAEKRTETADKFYNIDSILNVRFEEYEANKVRFDEKFKSIDATLPIQKKLVLMSDDYISMSKLIAVSSRKSKKKAFATQMNSFFEKVNEGKRPKKLGLIADDPYLFIIFYTFIEYYGEEAILKM